jgi:5-deoxy-glucuronate isomerase
MKHLYRCPAEPGFNRILNPGDSEMALTGFALLVLRAGEKHVLAAQPSERALIVLSGHCHVHAGGVQFPNVGGRKDVFSGLPYTVYVPSGMACEIRAVAEVELAVAESPSTRTGRPLLIGPDQVKTVSLGRDNFTRQAFIMVDDKQPSEHFFIGEAIVPPGNWGSFPPHRHEFDNPPDELDMEEIYFFRFNPTQGFGMQAIYTDARDTDTAYTVRHNDTIAIPRGYHPVVNAPGYAMYFLWIMTGQKRGFINHKDPAHSWIK